MAAQPCCNAATYINGWGWARCVSCEGAVLTVAEDRAQPGLAAIRRTVERAEELVAKGDLRAALDDIAEILG